MYLKLWFHVWLFVPCHDIGCGLLSHHVELIVIVEIWLQSYELIIKVIKHIFFPFFIRFYDFSLFPVGPSLWLLIGQIQKLWC